MLMLTAMLLELLLGWPAWLFARVRHPVVWVGELITLLEAGLNSERSSARVRFMNGALTTLIVLAVVIALAVWISDVLAESVLGFLLEALIASSLLATRSLFQHVADVSKSLLSAELLQARQLLSRIVGRDTKSLDQSGIASAALESLAENASDGVIAPLFWGCLLGLPGLAAYKAINTLDSMIGHRTSRYENFGRFAARLDDWANWLPARLTSILIFFAGGRKSSLAGISRQSMQHRSPNAGWPESAMAYALDVRLSGPRVYPEGLSDEPWLNATAASPTAAELQQGLYVYAYAMLLTALTLFFLGALSSLASLFYA